MDSSGCTSIAIAIALTIVAVGCSKPTAESSKSDEPVSATSASTPAPDEAELDDRKVERGFLVLHGDIVDTCSIRQPAAEQPWKTVLTSLAQCIGAGQPRGRRIVVRGDESARTVVGYVLAKLGVDEKRVQMTEAPTSACPRGDCPAERTVHIALSTRDLERDGLTVPVDRRTMVAFLSEDSLE